MAAAHTRDQYTPHWEVKREDITQAGEFDWAGGVLVYMPPKDAVFNIDNHKWNNNRNASGTKARSLRCMHMTFVSQKSQRGQFEISGGKRKENELPLVAAQRETTEENGFPRILFRMEDYAFTKCQWNPIERKVNKYHYFVCVVTDRQLYDRLVHLEIPAKARRELLSKMSLEVSYSMHGWYSTFVGLMQRGSALSNHDPHVWYLTQLLLLFHVGVPMSHLQTMYELSNKGQSIPMQGTAWFNEQYVGLHRYSLEMSFAAPSTDERWLMTVRQQLAETEATRMEGVVAQQRTYHVNTAEQLSRTDWALVVLWILHVPQSQPASRVPQVLLAQGNTQRSIVVAGRRKCSNESIEAVAQRKLWEEYQISDDVLKVSMDTHYAFSRCINLRSGRETQHFFIITVNETEQYEQLVHLPFAPTGNEITGRTSVPVIEPTAGIATHAFLTAAKTNLSLYEQSVNDWSTDLLLVLLHVGVLDRAQLIATCVAIEKEYQGLMAWADAIADTQRSQGHTANQYITTVHTAVVDAGVLTEQINTMVAQLVSRTPTQSIGAMQQIMFSLQNTIRICQ